MKTAAKFSIAVIAVLALAGGVWLALQQRQMPPNTAEKSGVPGSAFVDFSLPDLEGKTHSPSEWRGKWLLLNFWATWCPPCRKEMPLLVETQEKYGRKGLQIVGIAIDKKEDVSDFADTYLINYPMLLGDADVIPIMEKYGNRVGTLPYSVLISPEGKVLHRKMGAYEKEEMTRLLQPYLGKE